jgi:hypothetical protein
MIYHMDIRIILIVRHDGGETLVNPCGETLVNPCGETLVNLYGETFCCILFNIFLIGFTI